MTKMHSLHHAVSFDNKHNIFMIILKKIKKLKKMAALKQGGDYFRLKKGQGGDNSFPTSGARQPGYCVIPKQARDIYYILLSDIFAFSS